MCEMSKQSHSSADRPGEQPQRGKESADRRENRLDPCPDLDRLQHGLVGKLPANEQAAFERHVSQCPKCLAAMERLSRTDVLINEMRECAPLVERPPKDAANSAGNTTRLHSTGDAALPGGVAQGGVFRGNERFRIEGQLGAGGMGAVYQAYDCQRDERVALKVLHGCDSAAVLRLTREFRTLAGLAHPNLVSLYELYAADAVKFFTMELIDGCDFLAYVRGEGRRPAESVERSSENEGWSRLRKALAQLAAGLDVLHA